jgi:hypothetical protein
VFRVVKALIIGGILPGMHEEQEVGDHKHNEKQSIGIHGHLLVESDGIKL